MPRERLLTSVDWSIPATDAEIQIPNDQPLSVVGPLDGRERGVAFGPVLVEPREGGTVEIGGMDFWTDQPGMFTRLTDDWFDGWAWGNGEDDIPWFPGWLVGIVGAQAAVDEAEDETDTDDASGRDSSLTRRETLALTGATLAGLTLTAQTAAAQDDGLEELRFVEFDIVENPDGMRVEVVDAVSGVLPNDQDWPLRVNGDLIASIAPDGAATVPPGVTGTVSLSTEEPGWFASLGDPPTTVHELTLPADPTETDKEMLDVTTDPAILGPAKEAGHDELIFTLGGESIPSIHEDDDHDNGYYEVETRGEAGDETDVFTYTIGPDPPASRQVTVTIYPEWGEETSDDISRLTD